MCFLSSKCTKLRSVATVGLRVKGGKDSLDRERECTSHLAHSLAQDTYETLVKLKAGSLAKL